MPFCNKKGKKYCTISNPLGLNMDFQLTLYVSVCMWSHLSVHFLQPVIQHGLHILAAIIEVELKSSSPWNDRNQTAISTLSLKAVQRNELKREEKEIKGLENKTHHNL